MGRTDLQPDAIFCAAIELASPEERAAYLEQVCGDDLELRRRVEHLLEAHSQAGGFLAAPLAVVSGTTDWPGESAGTVIGPYKLLQPIGEGGMGAVWMAEQTQPVQRKVALKIIKAGMDSRQVLARFEAERQALAMMDHPNIAKVLDGGATATGRPFFVMELVKGQPITQYCDERCLSLQQRVELFVTVCQAIQHAHQKGIIHRDIKPSNVLVAPYDGKPVVKVIDFGVAKATGQRLTEKTLFTELGAVVGTVEYMSPEQAELNNQDIDTRSDIYALGVLLYELLTATTPLTRQQLKQAAFNEMLRLIREQEPPQPSIRLSDSKDSLPSISAQRHTEPAKLTKLVRGELDWIVMKALDKDRNRRYETANGFARDLERYLADEPVQACPPSAWYRFRKFARRNRATLRVAAVALLFLVVASVAAAWVMRDRAVRQVRETNDLDLAMERVQMFQRDGKRGEARAEFDNVELLAARVPADPARAARLADLKGRLAADARDQEFIARFEDIRVAAQSRVDVERSLFTTQAAFPEIQDALRHYGMGIGSLPPAEAAARIQGRLEPVRRELIAALEECLYYAPRGGSESQWLLDTLAAADNDVWRVRIRKALLESNQSIIEQLARKVDVEAQPVSFLLLVAKDIPAQDRAARLELFQRIQRAHPADLWANNELAFELKENGRLPEAIAFYTAALALRPDNAGIYLNRANAFGKLGQPDDAIADLRAAIGLQKNYVAAHLGLASALQEQGRLDEAIDEYRVAVRLKKDDGEAHRGLGTALGIKGELDDAIIELREAIRIDKNDAGAHHNLGLYLKDKGRSDEAIDEFRAAVRLKNDDVKFHGNLAAALYFRGELNEAIAEFRAAMRLDKNDAYAHVGVGNVLRDQGRLDEAIDEFRVAIRLKNDDAAAHNGLGSALFAKNEFRAAAAEFRDAIRLGKDYADAHFNLGNAMRGLGRLDDAITEYHEAVRLKKDYAEAYSNLGVTLYDKGQVDEAVAAYHEAIRLKSDDAILHSNLGNALRRKGDVAGAIRAYQSALKIDPKLVEAHCNLGLVFMDNGRFTEALAELQTSHELGSRRPGWSNSSADLVREVKELIETDGKVARALKGERPPADASERLQFALFCQTYRQEYAAAVAWYEEAFASAPQAADDLKALHRYNAACAAAQAACGRGRNADKLKDDDRTRLLKKALDWLRADLALHTKGLQGDKPQDRTIALEQLNHWQRDDDLVGVRDAASLAKLPAGERAAFAQLWADVETLLRTARGQQK